MLLIHAIYRGTAERLAQWLQLAPRRQFTTLDTHDGIGVVDVVDLLREQEIAETKEDLFARGAHVKKRYNKQEYGNLDIYQINCTYYSALGEDDAAYLLARAVQCFAPGIPQIYYVGLLAGANDEELVERTKIGRNINRHNYGVREIKVALERPVVQRLVSLLRFRAGHSAFAVDGTLTVETPEPHLLRIRREHEGHVAVLEADLSAKTFRITRTGTDGSAPDGSMHELAL
jgi:sucrose phosphorylase